MRAISEFRKTEFDAVELRANVNGRGSDHCSTIATNYGFAHGLHYVTTFFYKTDNALSKINLKGELI